MSTDANSPFRTFTFGELRTWHPPVENNVLIGGGLLNDDSMMGMVGAAKTFKSLLDLTTIADLLTARPLFGAHRSDHGRNTLAAFPIRQSRKVLLIEQEMGPLDMRERLLPIYNSLSAAQQAVFDENLLVRSFDHTIQLDTVDGTRILEGILARHRPDVLILDPLIEFHTSNENDTQSMNKIMRGLDAMRQKYRPLALIFIHHEGHPTTTPRQGIGRFRGNTVIGGKVDSAILVNVHNRPARILRLDFVLRRGRPIDSLYVQLDADTLRAEFLCWHRDPERKRKIGKSDDEDLPPVSGPVSLQ
jgi:hypothetical protein